MTSEPTCFVIMPFKEPYNTCYREVLQPSLKKVGLRVVRSDEIFHPKAFIQTIWECIIDADIVVAEMTGMNPNVLYELGLCHAIDKTVIMMTQTIDDLPADLRYINCICYDTSHPRWAEKLGKDVCRMVEGARETQGRASYVQPAASLDKEGRINELEDRLAESVNQFDELRSRNESIKTELESERRQRIDVEKKNRILTKDMDDTNIQIRQFKADNGFEIFVYPLRKTGLDIELVRIPAGEFIHGPSGSNDRIELPEYYVSRYSITNEQYVEFLNEFDNQIEQRNPWINLRGESPADRCRIRKEMHSFVVEDGFKRHPVTYVNYYGAAAFCEWAGGRLPTEEEWEKAARGDDGRNFPWGNHPPTPELANTTAEGWARDVTPLLVNNHPKGVSPYGCYQMVGNVWHWTSTYHATRDVQAVRGGSFFDFRLGARAVYRFIVHPKGPDFSQGFIFYTRFLNSVDVVASLRDSKVEGGKSNG